MRETEGAVLWPADRKREGVMLWPTGVAAGVAAEAEAKMAVDAEVAEVAAAGGGGGGAAKKVVKVVEL